MPVQGEYLGMHLSVSDIDAENMEYFRHCANHEFRLQKCTQCNLLRYPPTTACPWCQAPGVEWTRVEGKGEVHSYGEVHHPIQPGLKDHVPYLFLLVELDTQRGKPTEHEALRIVGNYCDANGKILSGEAIKKVGIGSRMRLVFTDVTPGIALPQFTLDETARQPAKPWRYVYE